MKKGIPKHHVEKLKHKVKTHNHQISHLSRKIKSSARELERMMKKLEVMQEQYEEHAKNLKKAIDINKNLLAQRRGQLITDKRKRRIRKILGLKK